VSVSETSQKSGCCEIRNLNTVLDGYPKLDSDHFVCGVPSWVLTALLGLFLLSGCGLAYFLTQTPNISFTRTLLLWAASGLAILLVVRPMSGSISFACDPKGAYFPSRKGLKNFASTEPQKWLLVPWSNISAINVQLVPDESGVKKLVTFRLRANDDERRVFFSGSSTLNFETGVSMGNRSSLVVGYPSVFKSPYRIVATLSRFLLRETIGSIKPANAILPSEH